TVTLTGPGRTVVGIDPSAAMLDQARTRPGGSDVEWRLGTSELIEPDSTDVVIMSGNVAMHILRDEWHRALAWNQELIERETPVGRLRESHTTEPPDEYGIVVMHCHNEWVEDGEIDDFPLLLQFRSLEQLEADLAAAGLRILNVWRSWDREPFDPTETGVLMVVEAGLA
ncbi:MAG: class I SAM-dependent methyltransferase, partial [bacterium]|nr:class I SAM-dependent methyltransferase [bacterium]